MKDIHLQPWSLALMASSLFFGYLYNFTFGNVIRYMLFPHLGIWALLIIIFLFEKKPLPLKQIMLFGLAGGSLPGSLYVLIFLLELKNKDWTWDKYLVTSAFVVVVAIYIKFMWNGLKGND